MTGRAALILPAQRHAFVHKLPLLVITGTRLAEFLASQARRLLLVALIRSVSEQGFDREVEKPTNWASTTTAH